MAPHSKKKAKRKAPAHAWKPGQSGNPGGRKKIPAEIVQAFRDLTPLAIETLKEAMIDADWPVRVKAAQVVLDRAHGRPVQPVVGDPDNPIKFEFSQVPDKLLRDIALFADHERKQSQNGAAVH